MTNLVLTTLRRMMVGVCLSVCAAGVSFAEGADEAQCMQTAYEDLILNGPWVAEDGRVWVFSVSTIYERSVANGIERTMPFDVRESDQTLEYSVLWAHQGAHESQIDTMIGQRFVESFTVKGDTLIVGDTEFHAMQPQQIAAEAIPTNS